MAKSEKTFKLNIAAIFTALIVVFQLLSYFVKIGTFNISLVLIPVVLGGVLLGPKYGAYFGGVFGVVVVICCITGMDIGGEMMFNVSPFMTSALCIGKGICAGLFSSLLYKAFERKNSTLATILAAIIAPITNTGIFVALTLIFFKDMLTAWAGGTNLVTYIIVGLTGINFIIELSINVILCPVIKNSVRAFSIYKR